MRYERFGSALLATAMVLLGCGASQENAEQGQAQGTPDAGGPTWGVPSGTTLEVALDRELSLKASDPGKPITATVSVPVIREGRTLIPSGTRVRGSITAIEDHPAFEGMTLLALDFQEIEIDGLVHPLHASLLAVEAQGSSANASPAQAQTPGREDTAPPQAEPVKTPAEEPGSAAPGKASDAGMATAAQESGSSTGAAASLGQVVRAPQTSSGTGLSGSVERMALVMRRGDQTATFPAGSVIQLRLVQNLELAGSPAH